MRDLVLDDLQVDLTFTPGKLRLDWRGMSHLQDFGKLTPFLERVAVDVLATRATLELHFEQTSYFNSATIVTVIRFVKTLCERNIGVRISFDPKHRWQKVFVDTMRMFDKKDGRFQISAV